LYTDV